MVYPYLGTKKIEDDKMIVIFFTENNKGVVVMSETQDEEYRFGRYGIFDENEFELLGEGICVRLNN